MSRIINFKTEYSINPICIETKKPRFSWAYELSNNFVQSSYKILVATSEALLTENTADMWNSGEVLSQQNINIVYAGNELKNCGRYFVKIIVKTTHGMHESDINYFEIAPDENTWIVSYRTLPFTANGAAIAFRRDFKIEDKVVKRARAYVLAIGWHEFYINGNKKGESLYNPVISDYNKRIYYNAYDITQDLKLNNGVGVLVGNGWNGLSQVCAMFYIEYMDGTDAYIQAGEYERAWKARISPITFSSVFDGEMYDSRLEKTMQGWSEYNPKLGLTAGWHYTAVKLHTKEIKIRAQQVQDITIQETIYPVKSNKFDGCEIIDFGIMLTGRCSIKVNGKSGAKVVLQFSEMLHENGTLNLKSLRNAVNTDVYILNDNGEQSWAPRFSFRGFRYVKVSIEGEAVLTEILAETVRTNTEKVGSFNCSDEFLNGLHEIAVRTEECNHQGILSDCPQRDERMGWLNDLTSRVYQTINNFGMELFFDKILYDIKDTMSVSGAIKDTAPYYIGNEVADPVSISYLLLGKFAFERYGDVRIVEKNYKAFGKWVNFLHSKTENGVLPLGLYGDWVPAIKLIPKNSGFNLALPIPIISTAYLYWHYELMRDFADILNLQEDKKYYSNLLVETKKIFNANFYNEQTGTYCLNVQAMNAIALSLGLNEEKEKDKILNEIIKDLEARDYHMTCGNQSYRHLLGVLAENGRNDVVMKILKNKNYPSVGFMLANGATTVWERWEKEISATEDNMHSYCHPMFASYDYWFYQYAAGINFNITKEGLQSFEIKPAYVEDLNFVDCSYNTPNGVLTVKYNKTNDKTIEYAISVPSNTKAKIVLPFTSIKNNCGVSIQDKLYNVASGIHTFTCIIN